MLEPPHSLHWLRRLSRARRSESLGPALLARTPPVLAPRPCTCVAPSRLADAQMLADARPPHSLHLLRCLVAPVLADARAPRTPCTVSHCLPCSQMLRAPALLARVSLLPCSQICAPPQRALRTPCSQRAPVLADRPTRLALPCGHVGALVPFASPERDRLPRFASMASCFRAERCALVGRSGGCDERRAFSRNRRRQPTRHDVSEIPPTSGTPILTPARKPSISRTPPPPSRATPPRASARCRRRRPRTRGRCRATRLLGRRTLAPPASPAPSPLSASWTSPRRRSSTSPRARTRSSRRTSARCSPPASPRSPSARSRASRASPRRSRSGATSST